MEEAGLITGTEEWKERYGEDYDVPGKSGNHHGTLGQAHTGEKQEYKE